MRSIRLGVLAGTLMIRGVLWGADPPAYDWGMVRGYFSGGVLLSDTGSAYSKQDPFLEFSLDKTWRYRPAGRQRRLMVNTFFDARLTATPASELTGGMVRRSAQVRVGAYLPVLTTEWRLRGTDAQALFVAPVVKGGEAVEGDAAARFLRAAGVRLGHVSGCGQEGVAPELLSYLDITRTNLFGWMLEGRLKVPGTPLLLGFDAVQGDVKLLVGARFDVGQLLSRLGVSQP